MVLAYVIAGKLGQATTNIRSGNLGPVWPAYGVAVAAILLYGYRIWPGLAAAAFLVAFLSPVSPLAAAGQAAGATLAALTAAALLGRVPGFDPALPRLRDALSLVVFGAFGSAIISASIGTSVLYATHIQPYSALGPAWLIYWLGDSTGVLLVTPLVFTLTGPFKMSSRSRLFQLAVLLILLTAACFVVFGDLPFVSVKLHALAFAVLPFVMWAAISFGVGGAALSVFLIATIATLETALGYGPFAVSTPFTNAVLLDVLFSVLAVSGLTLAAATTEGRNAHKEREELVREQAATDARLRLASIVESSDDAIFASGLDGIIRSWNLGAQRIFEFTESEVVGQPITTLIPPERWEEEEELLQRLRAGERVEHFETVRLTKAGRKVDVSLTASPVLDSAGSVVGIAAVARDIGTRKRAEEAITAMGRRLLEAQEQERTRIARELHDDISQRLALLVAGLGRSPHDSHRMKLQQQAADITSAVRSLSHQLHSSHLDHLGLAAAASSFCNEFSGQHGIGVEFDTHDLPRSLPYDVSLCLFRVLQESLQNSLKHSGTRHCAVQLWGTREAVHLIVRDQGRGFDLKSARESSGVGLLSMEERLKLVNGSLSVESVPDVGTTICARVPLGVGESPSQTTGH